MGETFIINLGRQAVWIIISVSGPLLFTALAIGVLVSIFQAVTQIQDMTLTFVPKFLGVMLVLVILGGTLLSTLVGFTTYVFSSIALFTH